MAPVPISEPTERERALRVVVLGALLGAALAIAARVRPVDTR